MQDMTRLSHTIFTILTPQIQLNHLQFNSYFRLFFLHLTRMMTGRIDTCKLQLCINNSGGPALHLK